MMMIIIITIVFVAVDAHFQSLHRSSATHCHLTSNHPRLCPSYVLKHTFFVSLFLAYSSVTLMRLGGHRNSSAILATLKILD